MLEFSCNALEKRMTKMYGERRKCLPQHMCPLSVLSWFAGMSTCTRIGKYGARGDRLATLLSLYHTYGCHDVFSHRRPSDDTGRMKK